MSGEPDASSKDVRGGLSVLYIALGVAAVGALIWGGLALKDAADCRGLEEDHVNAISSYREIVRLGSLGLPGVDADQAKEMNLLRIKLTLSAVYDQCGQRAGETASRKGSDELWRD